MKLFHMMEHLEVAGFSHIASFQPHGRAIRIHDPRRFQTDILPRYFPDNKNVGSFLRQLNIYGFRRMINNGPDRDSYYHAMFLRGRPDLCSIIERPLKSQHSKRQKYDPMTEPIFYTMPPIQMLPGCRDRNDLPPHGRPSIDDTQAIESGHRGKRQRSLSQDSCENDVKPAPTVNYAMATSPVFYNENCSTLPTHNDAIGRASTIAPRHDAGSLHPSPSLMRHDTQDGINNKGTIMSSDSTAFNNVMTSQDIEAAPIASFQYSTITSTVPVFHPTQSLPTSNVQQPPTTSTVPATVVAAAASLLATQHEPHFSIDSSSSSIIDQYCLNLATNILLKEISHPIPSTTTSTNSRQEVPIGIVQHNRSESQLIQPLEIDESNDSIFSFSLKRPATETMAQHRNVDDLGKTEHNGPPESDGSSNSSGSGMVRFLYSSNLDCPDSS